MPRRHRLKLLYPVKHARVASCPIVEVNACKQTHMDCSFAHMCPSSARHFTTSAPSLFFQAARKHVYRCTYIYIYQKMTRFFKAAKGHLRNEDVYFCSDSLKMSEVSRNRIQFAQKSTVDCTPQQIRGVQIGCSKTSTCLHRIPIGTIQSKNQSCISHQSHFCSERSLCITRIIQKRIKASTSSDASGNIGSSAPLACSVRVVAGLGLEGLVGV
jgi:hypothetical protein